MEPVKTARTCRMGQYPSHPRERRDQHSLVVVQDALAPGEQPSRPATLQR